MLPIVGRFYDRSYEPENPGIPLEEFTVRKGGKYRFRVIVASMTFVFKISVDNHRLHVIATDGCDVIEKVVCIRKNVVVFCTNTTHLDNFSMDRCTAYPSRS